MKKVTRGLLALGVLAVGCMAVLAYIGSDNAPAGTGGAPEVTDGPAATEAPAATVEPTAAPVTDVDLQAAADRLVTSLDEVDAAAGIDLFLGASVRMATARTPVCTVTLSDLWYAAPRFQHERLLDSVAGACVMATAQIRAEGDYPETRLVDTAEKELAARSILGFDSYADD